MKTNIIVKLEVEGVHYWPDCPIEEVSYLRTQHRHMFHILVKKQVSHSDRDIEIIQLKHQLKDHLDRSYYSNTLNCCQFGRMSCEQIAEELVRKFGLNYCSVLEDNENGAEVVS